MVHIPPLPCNTGRQQEGKENTEGTGESDGKEKAKSNPQETKNQVDFIKNLSGFDLISTQNIPNGSLQMGRISFYAPAFASV